MGNKDTYAKGLLVHQWVGSIDWDNMTADFLVLRVGQTGYANYPTGEFVDTKYTDFIGEASKRGIPVLAWYELYPKIYGDRSWPLNDYSRWYERIQDMSMTVLDRMLANRPYWHGMVISVNPGKYDMQSNNYETSAPWVSRTLIRVRDLVKAAYPGKPIWPEFASGIVDNKQWDTQGLLELDSQKWMMSAWDYSKSTPQTVTGVLNVHALSYPEEHMPMYLMPTRSGCLWRVKTVTWSGAKNASGASVALPVYLYYGSKESLYKAINFTPPTTTPTPPTEPPAEEPTEPTQPVQTVPSDMTVTNALLERIALAVEKLAGVLK